MYRETRCTREEPITKLRQRTALQLRQLQGVSRLAFNFDIGHVVSVVHVSQQVGDSLTSAEPPVHERKAIRQNDSREQKPSARNATLIVWWV